MYIVNVIPLTKIPFPNPQILSYFFSKKLSKGALVRISLRKKQINALVFSSENLEKKKLDIKKSASFKLKPIEKVVSEKPVLSKNQLKLLFWISEYYFTPLGLVARIFLSKKLPAYTKASLILTPEIKKLVFAPFSNLKSITIENADSSKYKSWGRKPYYDVRTIAKQLAKIHKAKLVLKNEFIENCKLKIENSIIDMREEIKKGNYSILSEELQKKIKKTCLPAGRAILFISRRGIATFILCRDCGYVLKCKHCEVPLVYHENAKLLCHHCGNEEKPPTLCPNCKGYRIKYFGAGTQRVEVEVKKLFPKKTILRLDSDVNGKPEKIIEKFNKLKNVILIGTQMLLGKNIKPVNLVGVISIETILNLPDYRSSERVFEILGQLKKLTKKDFIVQAYNPENSALDNNWKKFYNQELKARKALNYPPFSQIIKLSFEHKDPKKAEDEAKMLVEKLKQFKIQLLGPVPAFIPKIAGKYRWNIIIKSKIKNLKSRNQILIIVPSTWKIEVDPESLL